MMQLAIKGNQCLRIANSRLKKNMEKLSSAKEINRAGDGAAELAISEKMKAEITGLGQARRNIKDGISLIQTAEGALQEVHGMLDRLIELSDQSANGVYSESERESLQQEVEQLKGEINRIAKSTQFNGIPLLNGNLKGVRAWTEEEVHLTVAETVGVEHKPAVKKCAAWEGEVDLSIAKDGAIVKINDVTFEFDTDGTTSSDSNHIIVDISGGIDKGEALKAAIQVSSLKDELDFCDVSGSNGIYTLTLRQKEEKIQNGKGFTVSMDDVSPEFSEPEKKLVEAVTGKKTFTISDIKAEELKDGVVLTMFGKEYELDFDNTYSSSRTPITLTATTDLKNLVTTQLKPQIVSILKDDFKLISAYFNYTSSSKTCTLRITYPADIPASEDDIQFRKADNTPQINSLSQNEKGVDTPEVQPQFAAKTEEVDFSALRDGDIITINGMKYELDTDEKLKDEENIKVDITSITDPSEIAVMLETVVNASGNNCTVRTTVLDENKAQLQITSNKDVEGEKIEVGYESFYLDGGDDTGLLLQIGTSAEEVLRLKVDSMTTSDLGIDGISVGTSKEAAAAVGPVRDAINYVSSNRGTLGAAQNRLDHAYQSLGVSQENLTSAESIISSLDMAEEVMCYTKDQILRESAQGMLAQSMNLVRNRVQQLLAF